MRVGACQNCAQVSTGCLLLESGAEAASAPAEGEVAGEEATVVSESSRGKGAVGSLARIRSRS